MSANILEAIDNLVTTLNQFVSIPQELNDLEDAIYSLKNTIKSNPCGCPSGDGPDNEGGDSGDIVGQTSGGQEFTAPVTIDQRKCDAAFYIWDSVRQSLEWWEAYNVVELTGGVISSIVGLYSAFLIITGPFGAILTGIAGLLIAITLAIITTTLDLIDMVSVWTNAQVDIICCLYNAANTSSASTCVSDFLATTELDSGEIGFIMLFLPTGVLSLLFADTDESAAFFDGYESGFDCAPCVEPGATDWVILPANSWSGFADGHPDLGTGTVLNDGTQFTISSVPFTTGGQNLHGIGLIVYGFWLSQTTPGGLTTVANDVQQGLITRVSACPANTSGQQRSKPNCAQVDSAGAACSGAPQGLGGRVCLIFWRTASFTMDFTINTPPTPC